MDYYLYEDINYCFKPTIINQNIGLYKVLTFIRIRFIKPGNRHTNDNVHTDFSQT